MSTSSASSSSLPPGRRRFRGVDPDRRVAQRREQLLEAGLEAFGTRGFHAVGVREICSLAKLTERYFYESFKNREALFNAVHESAAKQIEHKMLTALASAPPDAKQMTRLGLHAALGSFKDDPRVARVLLIEVLGASTDDTAFTISQSFAAVIERVALGLYPNVSALGIKSSIVADGLYGSTVYIAMRWALGGFVEPLDEIVQYCALFYDGLGLEMSTREHGITPATSS